MEEREGEKIKKGKGLLGRGNIFPEAESAPIHRPMKVFCSHVLATDNVQRSNAERDPITAADWNACGSRRTNQSGADVVDDPKVHAS